MTIFIGTIIPAALFVVALVKLIRSFKNPERVLKEDTVEQLTARGKKPQNYLRYWRAEMVLLLVFLLGFIAMVTLAVLLVEYDYVAEVGTAVRRATIIGQNSTLLSAINEGIMVSLIVLGCGFGAMAYFGRGYYFGKWKIRFIAIPQGEPPGRTGSWRM